MKKTFKIIGIIFFILVGIGLIGNIRNGMADGTINESPVKEEKKDKKEKKEEKVNNIEDELKNNKEINVIEVNNNIDNTGFILVKTKHTTPKKKVLAWECSKILKTIANSKEYNNIKKVDIMIMGEFEDKYGKKTEQKICSASFNKSELDKIQWDSFKFDRTLDIASDVWFHQAVDK